MTRNKKINVEKPDGAVDFQPFPSMSPASLMTHNTLYRRRRPLRAEVRGKPMTIGLSARSWSAGDAPRSFNVSSGMWNFQLALPDSLVEALVGGLCKPASFHTLPALQQAVLIEAALENLLLPFEAVISQPLQFVTDADASAAEINLDLHVAFASFDGVVRLGLNAEAGRFLSKTWDAVPLRSPVDIEDLPFPVQILAGAQTLSITEISALKPGDTIMSEGAAPGEFYALCAGQLQARCIRSEPGLLLTSGWSAAAISRPDGNEILMERGTIMDEATIDSLSVRVIFELARTDMALRDVKALAEGSVVPVAALNEGAVAIIANGSKIGRGDIVRLGEGLGVRILQLGAND